MGLCLPCLGGAADDVVETPDPELKRRQLAEAAEKRQMEVRSLPAKQASSRGIKNPTSVDQKKKKKEEIDNMMANSAPAGGGGGGGGLRWQVG
ncbi:small VCP/p97-interacting protein isoform X1 [Phyllobates terribilis]|uniref:small VCP/p97-interacting protein isoform X1 n=1 Tax=Phyllobates terribilis TaxID=111132 RepID=UPI003CCB21E4